MALSLVIFSYGFQWGGFGDVCGFPEVPLTEWVVPKVLYKKCLMLGAPLGFKPVISQTISKVTKFFLVILLFFYFIVSNSKIINTVYQYTAFLTKSSSSYYFVVLILFHADTYSNFHIHILTYLPTLYLIVFVCTRTEQ